MESAALTVDERNPDYRIILNPILDDGGRVVGLAGMILDEEFLKKKLLPSIIASTLAKFLPFGPGRRARGHRDRTARDTTVVAVGRCRAGAASRRKARLGFVFTDWQMALSQPARDAAVSGRGRGSCSTRRSPGSSRCALIGGVSLAPSRTRTAR